MTSSDAPSDLNGTSLGERKLIAVLYADMVNYSRLERIPVRLHNRHERRN